MTSYSSNLAHFSKHARAQRAIFLKNKGTFPSEVGIGQNSENSSVLGEVGIPFRDRAEI